MWQKRRIQISFFQFFVQNWDTNKIFICKYFKATVFSLKPSDSIFLKIRIYHAQKISILLFYFCFLCLLFFFVLIIIKQLYLFSYIMLQIKSFFLFLFPGTNVGVIVLLDSAFFWHEETKHKVNIIGWFHFLGRYLLQNFLENINSRH